MSCIAHRGYQEIDEATKDVDLQFQAAKALLECLAKEFSPLAVAALLGTSRDRIIKKITGNSDIYAKKKRRSNKEAMKLIPAIMEEIRKEKSREGRFRKACLAAIVGNIIEFDIPGHEVDFAKMTLWLKDAERDLAIDHIPEIFKEVEDASTVLYLTDNAGEIAFDKLLVCELKKLGPRIIVAVKGGPILNDATLEDAQAVSMYKVADSIITTGADAVGLPLPEEQSEEFSRIYGKTDLVVAKGMGYAETLTEIELLQPHAFLLRTKCSPVARYFRVERGKNIAKLVRP
jgi:uncharacterized protein with ATP-grasp and redox domains